jgi:arylsulfatase A-like enzyme
VCGPSRMSFYAGRYMRSHGANWNGFPLRVGEPTLGDHLASLGMRTVLVGKTHMAADRAGMARLGIDPTTSLGVHLAECGFEPYERDDGLHPKGYPQVRPAYDDYLRAQGFAGDNPWEEWANSGDGANGWLLEHGDKPARVPEEHSETPYTRGGRCSSSTRRPRTGATGACICRTLSRIGPISPGALSRHVRVAGHRPAGAHHG